MAEHALCAPGPRVTGLLGQLPAILAFRRAQQTFKVQPRLPPRLGPAEQPTQPLLQRSQLIPPNEDARRYLLPYSTSAKRLPRDMGRAGTNSTVVLESDSELMWNERPAS